MDERTDTENVRLHDLIELLELGQQFYGNPIPGSSSDARRLHERSAHCYAAMLAEIRQWQARNDNSTGETTSPAMPSAFTARSARSSPPETYVACDFAALLQRVYRIYHSPSFPPIARRWGGCVPHVRARAFSPPPFWAPNMKDPS